MLKIIVLISHTCLFISVSPDCAGRNLMISCSHTYFWFEQQAERINFCPRVHRPGRSIFLIVSAEANIYFLRNQGITHQRVKVVSLTLVLTVFTREIIKRLQFIKEPVECICQAVFRLAVEQKAPCQRKTSQSF